MPHNFFYHPESFQENSVITLSKDEARHCRVMRLTTDSECVLLNGMGDKAKGIITENNKTTTKIRIDTVQRYKKPRYPIHIALAIIHLSRLEVALEKCTEWGVSTITLFSASQSEKKELSKAKQQRASHIIISALKQSGRVFLPTLRYARCIEEINADEKHLFYGATEKSPLFELPHPGSICFIIGPEKGFTEKEIDLLQQKHFQARSISDSVLRAETAAIGAACLSHYLLCSFPA
jgi:16S rRNA (uracil1498-N3)-methyltransferase